MGHEPYRLQQIEKINAFNLLVQESIKVPWWIYYISFLFPFRLWILHLALASWNVHCYADGEETDGRPCHIHYIRRKEIHSWTESTLDTNTLITSNA